MKNIPILATAAVLVGFATTRDEVLDWANRIVAEHPKHRAIVLTHSYLKPDKTRTTNRLKLKGESPDRNFSFWLTVFNAGLADLDSRYTTRPAVTYTCSNGL
jgi:hypothetical protein